MRYTVFRMVGKDANELVLSTSSWQSSSLLDLGIMCAVAFCHAVGSNSASAFVWCRVLRFLLRAHTVNNLLTNHFCSTATLQCLTVSPSPPIRKLYSLHLAGLAAQLLHSPPLQFVAIFFNTPTPLCRSCYPQVAHFRSASPSQAGAPASHHDSAASPSLRLSSSS